MMKNAGKRGLTPSLESDTAPIKSGAGKSPVSLFSAGFTIIELIVVITLFSILASVAIFNFGGFSESVNLSNLSQQIAGFVKKAQTAGSLGRVPPPGVNPTITGWLPTYGVYFSTSNPSQFIYFVDLDNSRKYDLPAIEAIETTNIGQGSVSDICVKLPNQSPPTRPCQNDLHITFQRPNLSAHILSGNTPAEWAEIYIKSLKGKEKKIVIYQVGQISVQNLP